MARTTHNYLKRKLFDKKNSKIDHFVSKLSSFKWLKVNSDGGLIKS